MCNRRVFNERELVELGKSDTADAFCLSAAGTPVKLKMQRQPSRLYGHPLADLIALSSI